MAVDIRIVRKPGFILNPDDDTVNNIFRELERKNGHCPTNNPNRRGHDQCPCADYLERGICYCKLYLNKEEYEHNREDYQRDIWGW